MSKKQGNFLRGDTLVEVLFSVSIFGLVAVSSISLMNKGLHSAEGALELAMARQEIDAQAEALRFIHSAYITEKGSSNNVYTQLWEDLINTGYEVDRADSERFFSNFNGEACDSFYYDENGDKKSILQGEPFVINYHNLALDTVNVSNITDVIIRNTEKLTPTATYPRLLYGINMGEIDGAALSDATSASISYNQSLYSAEGIWVTTIPSADGIDCTSEGGDFRPDFYDFYIRTCWDSPGGKSPSTISSTVRLYNPDQIDLSLRPQANITFSNVEWKYFSSTTYTGPCSGYADTTGDREPNPSSIDKLDLVKRHVIADEKDILFMGYTQNAMDEGLYYDIDAHSGFELEAEIDTSTILDHPIGGRLEISFGSANDVGSATVPESSNAIPHSVISVGLNRYGGTITTPTSTESVGLNKFKLKMSVDKTGHYEVFIDDVLKASADEPSDDDLRIAFRFVHNSHCCGAITEASIKDIQMTRYMTQDIDITSVCGTTTKAAYLINFDANGGTGTMGAQRCSVGSACRLSPSQFTKDGYIFTGWNTKADGSGDSFANRDYVEDLAGVGEEITLYAQYSDAFYNVRFDANGGSGTMSTQTLRRDTNTRLSSYRFSRQDYQFVRWNTKADGTGISYADGQSVNNLADPNQTITLYAQWAPVFDSPYTLTKSGLFIVLTWEGTSDRDAYLTGINNNKQSDSTADCSGAANSPFQLSYKQKTNGDYKTHDFTLDDGSIVTVDGCTIQLDNDARAGYDYNYKTSEDRWVGKNNGGNAKAETISLRSLYPGSFSYYVDAFNPRKFATVDKIRVRVFLGYAPYGIGEWPDHIVENGVVQCKKPSEGGHCIYDMTFDGPFDTDLHIWHAFDITVKERSSDTGYVVIDPVNKLESGDSPTVPSS